MDYVIRDAATANVVKEMKGDTAGVLLAYDVAIAKLAKKRRKESGRNA